MRTIEVVGDGVGGLAFGDRVATFCPARGADTDIRHVAVASLLKLPFNRSDQTAAAALLKGCITKPLVERCAKD